MNSFFELAVVKTHRIVVGILIPFVIGEKILAFPVFAAILVSGCPPASYLIAETYFELTMVENILLLDNTYFKASQPY